MLTNDFLKFSSATFPNERRVKMAMNDKFSAKIARKNGNDTLTRNSGTMIDENEVAIT